jgi:effector-binding domain-containing protein
VSITTRGTTPQTESFEIVSVERQPTAVVPVRVAMAAVPTAQRAARAKLAAALPALDAGEAKGSFTLWRPTNDGTLDMEPGVIVSKAFESPGEVMSRELPAGRAVQFMAKGGFERLPGAWSGLLAWCAVHKLPLAGVNWEIYGQFQHDAASHETILYALIA